MRPPLVVEAVGLVFRVLFRCAIPCLAASALVVLPAGAVGGAVSVLIERAVAEPSASAVDSQVLLGLAAAVGASLLVYPLALGVVAWMCHETAVGTPPSFERALSRLANRGSRALASFVVSLVLVVAVPAALAAATVLLGATPAAVIVSFIALCSFAFPAGWLVVRLSLAPAVAMIEPVSVRGSLRRSNELVAGAFWWVTGVLVLTTLGGAVVSAVVGGALAAGGSAVVQGIAQTVSFAVSTTIAGAAAGVLYTLRAAPERVVDPVVGTPRQHDAP